VTKERGNFNGLKSKGQQRHPSFVGVHPHSSHFLFSPLYHRLLAPTSGLCLSDSTGLSSHTPPCMTIRISLPRSLQDGHAADIAGQPHPAWAESYHEEPRQVDPQHHPGFGASITESHQRGSSIARRPCPHTTIKEYKARGARPGGHSVDSIRAQNRRTKTNILRSHDRCGGGLIRRHGIRPVCRRCDGGSAAAVATKGGPANWDGSKGIYAPPGPLTRHAAAARCAVSTPFPC
jgi:hypothetical protein